MNENQTLLALIKSSQRTNLISNIGIVFGTLTGAITSGIMIWQSYNRKKPAVAVRIIRKEGEIEKTELQKKGEIDKVKIKYETRLAKLYLELKTLKREMRHEAELKEFEVGLERKEEKELLSGADDLLNNLKNKGEGAFQKSTAQVKQGLDNLSALKDKGLKEAKKFTDQFKGLKDKFLDPKKD